MEDVKVFEHHIVDEVAVVQLNLDYRAFVADNVYMFVLVSFLNNQARLGDWMRDRVHTFSQEDSREGFDPLQRFVKRFVLVKYVPIGIYTNKHFRSFTVKLHVLLPYSHCLGV